MQYYRVSEVAKKLGISTDTVIRRFEGKSTPDVLVMPYKVRRVLLISDEAIDRELATWKKHEDTTTPPKVRSFKSLVKRKLPRLQSRSSIVA